MNEWFRKFAQRASVALGTPWAFSGAFFIVASWAVLGTIFGFSDSWQLVINTSTTIVTFLMVFLIQNTQNRDNRALHAKLDELIAKSKTANNMLIGSEQMSDEELKQLEDHYHELAHAVGDKRTSRADPADDDEVDDEEPAEEEQEKAAAHTRSYHRLR